MQSIRDIKDPRISAYEQLWRKGKSEDYFLAEGYRLVELALTSKFEVQSCLVDEDYPERQAERFNTLQELTSGKCPLQVVSGRIMARFSETKSPQGVVLVLKKTQPLTETAVLEFMSGREPFRCFVLEKVQDPGNVGSIIRTAEALGYDAIFYSEGTAQPFAPKALRASMGSALFIPLIPFFGPVTAVIERFRQSAVCCIGTALEGQNLADFAPLQRVAILIGNEGEGLSKEALAMVDKSANIPMCGKADSLNAAAAAAILAYHFREL